MLRCALGLCALLLTLAPRAWALAQVEARGSAREQNEEPASAIENDAGSAEPAVSQETENAPSDAPAASESVSATGRYRLSWTAPRAPMHFRVAPDSDRADLTFYVQVGTTTARGPGGTIEADTFDVLCQAPCEANLHSGTHVFGIAAAGRPTVKVAVPLHVRRGDTVLGSYQSRIAIRIAGWALLLGGVSSGAVFLGQGMEGPSHGRQVLELTAGGVLTALGLLGGLWLANIPDRATVVRNP